MPSKYSLLWIGFIGLLVLISLYLPKLNFSNIDKTSLGFIPVYSAFDYPRKVLLFSADSPKNILVNRHLIRNNRFEGIIIYNPSIKALEEDLKKYRYEYKKLNKVFRQNYLGLNFVDRELPSWDDTAAWKEFNERLKQTARFAKKSGFKGLFIETSDPKNTFWNPEWNTKYKTISDDFASKIIYQRGREVAQIIYSVFPRAQILVSPIGLNKKPLPGRTKSAYVYWIHFINGLFSTRNLAQVCFLAETSNLNNQEQFAKYLDSSNLALQKELDEVAFWRAKGGISFIIEDISISELFQAKYLISQKFAEGPVVIKADLSDIDSLSIIKNSQNIKQKLFYCSKQQERSISFLEYLAVRIYTAIKGFLKI